MGWVFDVLQVWCKGPTARQAARGRRDGGPRKAQRLGALCGGTIRVLLSLLCLSAACCRKEQCVGPHEAKTGVCTAPQDTALLTICDPHRHPSAAPPCAVCWLLQTPLTRESHSSGVSLKDFYQNQKLNDFFAPLSLSLDKEGKVRPTNCAHSRNMRPTSLSQHESCSVNNIARHQIVAVIGCRLGVPGSLQGQAACRAHAAVGHGCAQKKLHAVCKLCPCWCRLPVVPAGVHQHC